jgi:transcriptional regulator with XRE-family HTH domain
MTLAKALNMSRPVISRAENEREAVPSDPVIRLIAKATRADLPELLELARRARAPRTYFARWADDYEQRATMLRIFEPLLVPGLFQTESYARALLSWHPLSDGLDDNLRERLTRQTVLDRAEIRVLILGSVLDREIGNASVMAEQVDRLLNIVSRTTITIQIVPDTSDIGGALSAGFMIASEHTTDTACYTDSLVQSGCYTDPAIIERAVNLFDGIRADALPWRASAMHLRTAGEKWTS